MKKNYLLLFLFGFLSFFVNAQAPGNIRVTTTSAPDICNPGESATLSCNYFQIFQQTGYTVSSILYSPPFGATAGSATNLTIDDRWSGIVDLKGLTPQDFNFCFYNNNYLKCLVSTNGAMSFSVAGVVPGGLYTPNGGSAWSYSASLPSNATDPPFKNAIHGVYQDTHPGTFPVNSAGLPNINYYTTGTYPNRAFVVNFSNLAQFSTACNTDPAVGLQTSQIVLYEATNIIDVYVLRRVPCTSWNGGNGLIGIQNSTGALASFPATRNTGAWTATNEAWRFTPNGVQMTPTLQWTDNLGNVVGNTQTITVSPNATTTYTVTATYPSCSPGITYQVSDQTTVNLIDIPAGVPSTLYNCEVLPAPPSYSWDFTPNGTAIMAPLNPANYVLSYHTSLASAMATDANIITGSTTNYTTPGGTVTIWAAVEDLNTGCRDVQSFTLVVRPCTASPVQPPNLVACDTDGNGTESFNLTQQNTTILGGQNAADYNITYHTTLASADGTNLNSALIPAGAAVGQNQNFVSAGQTIYVRMERVGAPSVFGNTTFQLIVNPRPAITGTLSICIGATTQLTGAGTPASSNAWTSSDTTVATVNSSGLVTGVAAGTAIMTYTDNNGCSNTATVTINALPTVTVNSPVTCQGGTVTLTATPGTPGTYNYVWTVPAGVTNPGNVASFTTSIGGAYGVVITDPVTNCSSSTGAGTVTVNPLPTVTVNSPTVCSGNAATVTATAGDASAYSYAWTVPAGLPNPGNVNSFSTTIPGTYSVIITNTVTTCSSASASGTVSFNPLPTVTVNSSVVCAGTSASITATPGAAGTYSYAWTVPGGATNPGNVANFSTTIAGTYSVIITNTLTGCSSASASGTLTVNPLPTVSVNSPSVCPGVVATVTATPGVAGTYTYVWTVPGGATNPGNVASFTTTTLGTYSVVITDPATNCSSVSASGTVSASPVGGSMNLQCGGYNATTGEIYIDWSNVPGVTTFNYSYSIAGGAVVTGSQNAPSSIYVLTNGQPITFTLSGVGTVCVQDETITCGCPTPIINTVPNVLACSGQTVNQINFTTSDSYDTVSWTNSNPAIGLAASGTTNFLPSFTAATVTTPQTATITVILTKFGCAGPARTFTITVNPLPTVTVNSPVTCAGTNTNVTATPGAASTYSFAWTVPAGFPNPGNVPTFATSVAGNYSVIITNTATGCVSASASGTVTVNPLPTVTVNNATVCTGASATLTATPGSVGNYSYTWTVPTGAVNPGNVATFSTTVAGTYSVIITDTVTNCSSVSASGTVANNPLPTVTVNSPSVCSGALATVTATPGSASTYSYAWTVPGGATNPGNVASFTTSVAGIYSVIITDTATTCSSASASGTVTVNQLPTVTVNSPVTCSGTNTNVTATPGTVATYSYAWTVPAGFPNPGNVPSFATSIAGTYSVVITNTTTGCISSSASGTVTVNPLPTVTVNNTIVCAGDAATLTAAPGSVGTYSYAWTVPAGAVNPGDVASFSTTIAGTYSVIITDITTNCSSASASGTVSNNPLPTVTVNSPSICSGILATIVATPGSAGTYSYVWTVPNGVADPGDVPSFTTSTPGAYSVVITNMVTNCSSVMATGNVTLNPIPTVTASPASQSLCSGQSTGIQLQSDVANTSFSWTFTQTGGVIGASNGTGNIISQVLTAGTSTGTVTYTITPTSAAGCVGNPITVTVTVTPVPVVNLNTTAQSICTGGTTNITMSSNIAAATFNWNVVQSGGVTGGTSGTGTSINDVLTTSGTIIGYAIYTITPINNGCPGTPKTVTVTVYPNPNVTASPSVATLCSGGTTNIVLNSNVPGTTFTWTVLQTGLFGAASGTGNTISQTLTTVGLNQGQAVYTIIPTVNGCTGAPTTVTVTVNPTPEVFSSSVPQVICSGVSSGITVTPNLPGTSIIWTVVQDGVTGASDGNGSETTPGAGIAIDQILTTTGNAQGTATYTITPINNGCSGDPITVVIKVNPLPSINIPDGVVCIDSITGALIYGYVMDTELSAADYDFQWYFGNDMATVISTSSSYTATEDGQYTVSIMNSVTGCTEVFMINVDESNPAQSATAVVTNYFEDSQAITVTVAGTGSYLYSLDGGAFQTSNVFLHVLPGTHTVTIHDAAGCTDITLTNILTIGYPNFFTPNGDGYNDTWNIWSLQNDQPNSEIHIFDRYGKLIKQIVPAGSGWDGTYNGQLLPSTDYWFTIKYMENGAQKEFRSHFSMKR